MEAKSGKSFDQWAIVELMGHNKVAGRVTDSQIGGSGFIRIDIPDIEGNAESTKFYSPSAIYAIHPTTKELACKAAQLMKAPQPITEWELRRMRPAIAAGEPTEEDPPMLHAADPEDRYYPDDDGDEELSDPDDLEQLTEDRSNE